MDRIVQVRNKGEQLSGYVTGPLSQVSVCVHGSQQKEDEPGGIWPYRRKAFDNSTSMLRMRPLYVLSWRKGHECRTLSIRNEPRLGLVGVARLELEVEEEHAGLASLAECGCLETNRDV